MSPAFANKLPISSRFIFSARYLSLNTNLSSSTFDTIPRLILVVENVEVSSITRFALTVKYSLLYRLAYLVNSILRSRPDLSASMFFTIVSKNGFLRIPFVSLSIISSLSFAPERLFTRILFMTIES